jgi:hypothetical protein
MKYIYAEETDKTKMTKKEKKKEKKGIRGISETQPNTTQLTCHYMLPHVPICFPILVSPPPSHTIGTHPYPFPTPLSHLVTSVTNLGHTLCPQPLGRVI